MTDADTLDEYVEFAQDLAAQARPIARQYFRQPLDVERKKDLSPVTIADRAIEAKLRESIATAYPDHGIFGEEHGHANPGHAITWVIDPIDGTKSFITGMPTFGTLVALLDEGHPTIGVVDMPVLDERWLGVSGRTTLLNGRPCRTSECRKLDEAALYATSPDIFDSNEAHRFEYISARAKMRRFGGDCYSYALLASGHIDAVVEMQLQPYDYLSLVPVIEGAGGVITDWRGETLSIHSDGRVVAAASAQLHQEILELMAAQG